MEIEHEVDERAREPCAQADEDGESRPRELRAAREVDDAQPLGDVPVRPAARRGGLAPRPHHLVARDVAVGELGERQVGDEQGLLLELGFDATQLGLEAADARAQLAALLAHLGRKRARFLEEARVGFRGLVALGLELVEPGDQRAAPHVQRLELVEQPRDAGVAAAGQRTPHLVGRGTQQLQVDHGPTAGGSPARGRGSRSSHPPGF